MEDEELRKKLRTNGWQAVKNFTPQYLAKEYEKLFNRIMHPDEICVSVIIPATYDRAEHVKSIIDSLAGQSYKNIEAVVIWDEEQKKTVDFVSPLTIKQLFTGREGYNLAMARNLGIIEAIGDVLVFCDSRICPEADSIRKFAEAVMGENEKAWFFGDKGSSKNSFVENFSAIKRQYLVNAGMFNERIVSYGGMSQELRSRFISQGFSLKYLPEAKAKELKSSKLSLEKRKGILEMKTLLYKLNLKK
jgi:cellulose synthase/poly-beta-1,6-N-acetylglucosamine synthase-like glycosyltransferase